MLCLALLLGSTCSMLRILVKLFATAWALCYVLKQKAVLKQKGKQNSCNAGCPQSAWALQVFQTMVGSGVELTITTFGTLLIAGADAHDYNLVQEVIIISQPHTPAFHALAFRIRQSALIQKVL